MRLTYFSDYALRLLMFAATSGDRLFTIEEAAHVLEISRTHLYKVANTLSRAGLLKAIRGRSGGLALGKDPDAIRIGDVVRLTEPDFALVECFTSGNQCTLTPACKLSSMLGEALASFQATLDRYTLADIVLDPPYFPGVAEALPPRQSGAATNHRKRR